MTLLILAAGMGSRYGGLKQLDPITDNGEFIIDFSVYDAIKAGFSKVVFIIREEMYAEFKYLVGDRISKNVDVEYVFQDVSALPVGREKPFGTVHAVLCCKETVKEPFAIGSYLSLIKTALMRVEPNSIPKTAFPLSIISLFSNFYFIKTY